MTSVARGTASSQVTLTPTDKEVAISLAVAEHTMGEADALRNGDFEGAYSHHLIREAYRKLAEMRRAHGLNHNPGKRPTA